MKTHTLPTGSTIRIPSTGDDWQLYTCSMGCSRAAQALTRALLTAFRRIDKYVAGGATVTAAAAKADNLMYKVHSTYAAYGAADSEPHWVRRDALARYCAMRYGTCIYTIKEELY